jgi:SAM-dependent methyltransferase
LATTRRDGERATQPLVMVSESMSNNDIPREQTQTYFGHLRLDVLAMVPPTATKVLSVGCGEGRTEAELVKRGCHVTGIELDPRAALLAREKGIEALVGDVNEVDLAGRTFDSLIYADVLEHLADPVSVLGKHVALLEQGGTVIVSVPNFRHYSVFRDLFLRGRLRYSDAGMFDRTHLRITTRRMVEDWFSEVQLRTESTVYQIYRRGERYLCAASFNLATEFLASQVILRGIKTGGSGPGK